MRSKSDPLCDQVELIDANPNYAHIRHPDGRETTVSLTDLAPCPQASGKNTDVDTSVFDGNDSVDENCNEIAQAPTELPRSSRVLRPPESYGDCHYY